MVEKRVVTWKKHFFFFKEQGTLIKNMISSLLTCFMSLFTMPIYIAKQNGKTLKRDFFVVELGGVVLC